MTIPKSRGWPLGEAREVGEDLATLLRPACLKGPEVAGSVRRNRPLVGDVELLAVPKVAPTDTLWLERPPLDKRILELIAQGVLGYRLNKKGARAFGPLNKLLIHVPSGIAVDLFSTTAENWGLSLVVRTGPKDFNIKMMTRFRALGLLGHVTKGVEDLQGNHLPTPTEEEVFRLLQWPYVEPEKRG